VYKNPCVSLAIAQFVARRKGYKVEGQTGVTGTYPTQCHHDGRFFLFREVGPGETSPVTWGFEEAKKIIRQ
jgi:hypothetical protein